MTSDPLHVHRPSFHSGGGGAAFGEGVVAHHSYSNLPGQISAITLKSTQQFARQAEVVISNSQGGSGFSVEQTRLLSNLLPHGQFVTDESRTLDVVKQACPDAKIMFRHSGHEYDLSGARALVSFCSSTESHALPSSLSDITCPNTGLELTSMKDVNRLSSLVDSYPESFAGGGYVILADASRLSVLNRTEGRDEVTSGLAGLADRLRDIFRSVPCLINRMGDEIFMAVPASDAERLKQHIIGAFRTPIVSIRPFTEEVCAARDAIEAIESGFIAKSRYGRSMNRFIRHLRSSLLLVQQSYKDAKDRKGDTSGTIDRVIRVLDSIASKLYNQTGRRNYTQKELLLAQTRISGFLIDLLIRSQRRFARFQNQNAFTLGATIPGAFDISAVYLTREEIKTPENVELALHACSKLVSRKKKGAIGVSTTLFSRDFAWRDIARRSKERSAITRFNSRVSDYSLLSSQLRGISDTRLLDKFALSVQLTSLAFGHPHIDGVFQLRAIATERPATLIGVVPNKQYRLMKVEVNLKPFNDLGYDLGDRAVKEVASVVGSLCPGSRIFVEGGEISVLLRSAVALSPELSNTIANQSKQVLENMMEQSFFPASKDSEDPAAETQRKRDNFQRRGIYSVTWKRLLKRMRREQDYGKRIDDLYLVRVSDELVRFPPRSTFAQIFGLK